jgi:hypothetical protein
MSTIVKFCHVRDREAATSSVFAEETGMLARNGAKTHDAEIILLPRTYATAKKRTRKPLKRRFALRKARY